MATTLSAFQSGNLRMQLVVAVDGYDHLISNAPEASVQAAWADTDWATKSVLGGLVIELDNHQQLNPWNPFTGGGRVIIKVQPDSDDTLGIAIARTDDGAETLLEETAGRTTPLFVGFADGFTVPGEAHCGTECFEYGFIAGRLFHATLGDVQGSNRGKYVAHGVKDSVATYGSVRFSEHHRVENQDNGVRFQPVISAQPRTWRGRRVTVWAHTYNPLTQAMNTKADALCVFVGELSEIQDDSDTGHTHILAEHYLNKIPKTMLGRNSWQAVVDYGLWLKTGQRFKFQDFNGTTTKSANDLVVKRFGATGSNEVNAGRYGHEEFASIFNQWLGGEGAAGRINGNYTLTCPEDVDGSPRSVLHYFVPGSTSNQMWYNITWPIAGWAKPLGFPGTGTLNVDKCGAAHATPSPNEVQPFSFVGQDANGFLEISFEHSIGTFVGQNETLPAVAQALLDSSTIPVGNDRLGLFILECETPTVLLGTVVGNSIKKIRVLKSTFSSAGLKGIEELKNATVPIGAGPPKIRQIFAHEAPVKTMLKWIMYSTGTAGYNHADYDVLPHGQGLGIPYDLLGADFEQSCDAMPGANDVITLLLEKPRTVTDALAADLVMRNAHLVFREGKFEIVSWVSPASAIVTKVLNEDNKAEPIDTRISHRSASVLDSTWVRNFVKINYNRDIGKAVGSGEDVFLATPIVLEDATSIDDMGGVPSPVTLDLRNVYNDTDQIGQGVRALSAGLLSWLALWGRPLWKVKRSIAPTLFEGFGVSDCVALTDPFVRDPTTGRRGIVTRPGLVVEHHYMIHSAPAPQKLRFSGECTVAFTSNDRTFAYGPCAELDATANTGGFTAGYDGNRTLQFKAHEHSEASEDVDVDHFELGDAVKIIAIDPDDPAVVDYWDRTLSNVDVATNQVTVDVALSSPAFDSNKRYRMVYDGYPNIVGDQAIKSFQAGSNKTIAEVSPPDVYGAAGNDGVVATEYDHTRLPELPADVSYGPSVGASRDCGYDKELALLIDNMIDSTTRLHGAILSDTASTNSANVGWQILRVEEIPLGDLIYGNGMNRYIWLAPIWTTTGGSTASSVYLRAWISGYPPSGDSSVNLDNASAGYTIRAPAAGNEWGLQPTDTAWRNSSPQAYPLGNFNGHQFVYLIIEGTKTASVRGLHWVIEGERFST